MPTHSTAAHRHSRFDVESPHTDHLLQALEQGADRAAPLEGSVAQALQYICAETGEPLVVDEVATAVGVSRRTLERRFRATFDCTVRHAITTAQLLRAKRLLATTDLPVIDVAMAAGFSYADRLGKVFLRIEGITPSQYRARFAADKNT